MLWHSRTPSDRGKIHNVVTSFVSNDALKAGRSFQLIPSIRCNHQPKLRPKLREYRVG